MCRKSGLEQKLIEESSKSREMQTSIYLFLRKKLIMKVQEIKKRKI